MGWRPRRLPEVTGDVVVPEAREVPQLIPPNSIHPPRTPRRCDPPRSNRVGRSRANRILVEGDYPRRERVESPFSGVVRTHGFTSPLVCARRMPCAESPIRRVSAAQCRGRRRCPCACEAVELSGGGGSGVRFVRVNRVGHRWFPQTRRRTSLARRVTVRRTLLVVRRALLATADRARASHRAQGVVAHAGGKRANGHCVTAKSHRARFQL